MVYESYPWKQDLLRRKRLFLKYNTVDCFEKNEDAAYTVLEKSVFYSAFIIRKLIDCGSKLSDEAENYTLKAKRYKPLKEINRNRRWPEEDSYDWKRPQNVTKKGKDICNSLIHSYVFFFSYDEGETVDGFFVTSDYDRNKALYYIAIQDWLSYIDFIASDDITCVHYRYDNEKSDYIFQRKERGV